MCLGIGIPNPLLVNLPPIFYFRALMLPCTDVNKGKGSVVMSVTRRQALAGLAVLALRAPPAVAQNHSSPLTPEQRNLLYQTALEMRGHTEVRNGDVAFTSGAGNALTTWMQNPAHRSLLGLLRQDNVTEVLSIFRDAYLGGPGLYQHYINLNNAHERTLSGTGVFPAGVQSKAELDQKILHASQFSTLLHAYIPFVSRGRSLDALAEYGRGLSGVARQLTPPAPAP